MFSVKEFEKIVAKDAMLEIIKDSKDKKLVEKACKIYAKFYQDPELFETYIE